MVSNGYSAYKGNSILTASPLDLITMLYDGAIKFCNLAIKAIEEKNLEKVHNNIIRAEEIVEELQGSLDTSYEVAADFYKFYEYVYNILVEANLAKDKELLNIAVDMLRAMKATWKEAIHKSKNKVSV